jgi:hypothetical protein
MQTPYVFQPGEIAELAVDGAELSIRVPGVSFPVGLQVKILRPAKHALDVYYFHFVPIPELEPAFKVWHEGSLAIVSSIRPGTLRPLTHTLTQKLRGCL